VTRDYFYKALSGIMDEKYQGRYSIFEGQNGRKVPSLDSALLRSGVFKAVGKLMAHSLIHCGVAAFGVAQPVVEYILSDNIDSQFPFTVSHEDVVLIFSWTDGNQMSYSLMSKGTQSSNKLRSQDLTWNFRS
jgi:hypothetical protein